MRFILTALAALFWVLQALPSVHAQDAWPSRNVTIIVPFTAGGTADLFARLVANHMQQTFGQSFVVENRGGAGGNILEVSHNRMLSGLSAKSATLGMVIEARDAEHAAEIRAGLEKGGFPVLTARR